MKSFKVLLILPITCLSLLTNYYCFAQDLSKLKKQSDSLNNIFIEKNFSNDLKAMLFTYLANRKQDENSLYEALYYYKQAAVYYDIKSRKKELAELYVKIGDISKKQYDFENSLEYYFQAIQLFHEIKDYYNESRTTEKIANIYIDKGLEKIGLKYSMTARNLYLTNPIKYRYELSVNSYNLGILFHKLHKNDSSIIWYRNALSYTDNSTKAEDIAAIYNNIGSIYYDEALTDSAFYYYTKAYNIIKEVKNDFYLGVILQNLGEIKEKNKKYDDAFIYYSKALKLLEKEKAYDQLLNLYLDFKDYYKNENDYKKSNEYLEKYILLKSKIASTSKLNNIIEIEKLYEIKDKENKIRLLEKEKQLVEKEKKIKTIWQNILIGSLILLIFIGILIFRNLKIVIKNKELKERLHNQEKQQFETELQFKEKLRLQEKQQFETELRLKDKLRLQEKHQYETQLEFDKVELELKKIELENKNKDAEHFALRIVEKNKFIESIEQEIDGLQGTEKDKKHLLKITNNIRHNISLEKETFDIESKINELYEGFFRKLEEKHPELSKTEKRLSSLMVLNLDTKDIASLLNITLEGVRKGRQRLRKKLTLNSEDDIVNYLKGL